MKPEADLIGKKFDEGASWEWARQAILTLASKDPKRAPESIERIVETVRVQRPELLGLALPKLPVAENVMSGM